MLTIKATGSVKDIIEHARKLHGHAVPYAAAAALTRTAHIARTHTIPEEMRRVFNDPRPYVQNGLFVTAAKKDDLNARIAVKNMGGSGTKQQHILLPSVEGGRRNAKRSERFLALKGLMRDGERIVPAKGMSPEEYESGAFIKRVLKDVTKEKAPKNPIKKGKKQPNNVPAPLVKRRFAGAVGHNKTRGIWEAEGRTIKPLFIFTATQPSYRSVFGFQKAARETAEKHFRDEFNKALAEMQRRFSK